jgi:uncharacterized glyoxalase superfamily protein PhnB
MTDQELLDAFDAGRLDPAGFPHAAHVRVAWLCLRDAPFEQALGRLRRGLKHLAIRAGQPHRYHETITAAYLRLIERQVQHVGATTWEEFARQSPDLLAPDMHVLHELYDRATLDSPEARGRFVQPASWNGPVLDRFLEAFARHQDEAEQRTRARGLPALADPDPYAAEPVSAMAVLNVSSVERAVAWYASTFGFDATPVPERPPYQLALLSRGGAELMLRAAADPATISPPPGWSLCVRLAGGRIRELHADLAARGDHVSGLREMPYGDLEFEVRDPDGYTLLVSEAS